MSFFRKLLSWLLSLFGPRTHERDVTRLSAGGAVDDKGRAADAVKERVVTSGPLKDKQRRLVKRDPRLLPKGPRKSYWEKRPKVMTADESRRLFSASLRSRDRNLFDLLADEAQLERHGLPIWRTEADVARALGVPVKTLRHYSIHRPRDKAPHYVAFAVKKRSGGERIIMAPKARLKALQRTVHELLVGKLPVSPHAHGFVKGRSVKTNAAPHVKKAVVVKLDLKDFFPSVSFARVRGMLVALGYGYPVAATLAVLLTESQRQPVEVDGVRYFVPVGPRVTVQGAPTSPGLCNAIASRLDRRLAGFAKKNGFAYTRYADDLTFSGDDPSKVARLIAAASKIIKAEGFEPNAKKTRIMRRGNRQLVAGVTVNEVLGLSRKERRKIRAALHNAKKSGDQSRKAELEGKLGWVHMLNAEQAAKLRA